MMKRTRFLRVMAVFGLAGLAASAWAGNASAGAVASTQAQSSSPAKPIPTALPRDSVYQLKVPLIDQNARPSYWGDGPQNPRIVSMFYSNCEFVCPMLFEAIKVIEAELPAPARQRLRVDMVSLDPQRDTPATLKKTASQRSVDETRWHLYRAKAADVRKLAATLGIQYRQLSSGEFNHSTVLILLDAQGRVVARTEKISAVDPVFLKAVVATLVLRHASIGT